MDHDDKITGDDKQNDSKVQLFLHDSLKSIRQDDQKLYNLETEFAKTGKQRSYFAVKILAVTAIIFIALSWVITSKINRSSRNVPVDITVFEDINLKNVLDMAKKAEDKLDGLVKQQETLEANYQSELADIRSQKATELELISAQLLSTAAKERRRNEIAVTYGEKERKLTGKYKAELASLAPVIADAKKDLDSFDRKRVEDSRKQKKILDNQRDLYELEKKKLKDSYEAEIADLRKRLSATQNENSKLKSDQIKELLDGYQARIAALDPVLNDPAEADYLARAETITAETIPFKTVPANIPDDFSFGRADFTGLGTGYDGLAILESRLASIPFENSAGKYITAANKLALQTGVTGEKIINEAFSRIQTMRDDLSAERQKRSDSESALDKANERLSTYETLLSGAAAANGYDGYVTGLDDPAAPMIFLQPDAVDYVLSVENPEVYVYRGNHSLIATLSVTGTDDGIAAAVTRLEKHKDLQLMDYISLNKK